MRKRRLRWKDPFYCGQWLYEDERRNSRPQPSTESHLNTVVASMNGLVAYSSVIVNV